MLLLISTGLWFFSYQTVAAEVIKNFTVDIALAESGSFVVTETIVYDFEGSEKHGIFRNVKSIHSEPASAWYKERYIDLELVSVTRDGQSEPYDLQSYEGLSVRIGDSNQTISGVHTYQIIYKVEGALSTFGEVVDLYWNVTGNEWVVPIEQVVANVYAAKEVLTETNYCYVVGTECKITEFEDGVTFTTGLLYPGEEITIAQALNLKQPPAVLERTVSLWFWLAIFLVWLIGLSVAVYKWKTKFRFNGPIIAQYEPLKDFKPMFTGVLFDNSLDPRDITAGIIYLAEQGFIKIKQTKDKVLLIFETTDYEVTLLRPISEVETDFQKTLLELLFDTSNILGTVIKLSKLKSDTTKQRANFTAVQNLRTSVTKDLTDRGYIDGGFLSLSKVGGFLLILIVVYLATQFVSPVSDILGKSIIPFVFIVIFSGIISLFGLSRRTEKSYVALNYLQGFREFLSVTETERYKFHNAPAKSPEQFMEYLPYAIAFGVEKEWGEVFKDIAISSPGWYSGQEGGANFNAMVFSSSLNAFSGSFASASSSSSSSGGGSSGGGSGGGGGGSW